MVIISHIFVIFKRIGLLAPKGCFHGNRFCAGQACAAPAPGPAVAEPAAGISGVFFSGFFPASVLRLDERCVALGVAAVGVHVTVVGYDDRNRCAAAANGAAYLPAGHVRAVCAADDRALRALSADGHVLFLCRPRLCGRRRAVYQRVLLPPEERRVVQSRRVSGHDALRRDLHAADARWPPRRDRGRRAGGRVRGGHSCRAHHADAAGRHRGAQ